LEELIGSYERILDGKKSRIMKLEGELRETRDELERLKHGVFD